ncbi:MAG: hypothetical protein AAB037_07225, partial [Chloroflexota bacterium]
MAIDIKLRPYQVEVGRAILDSVLHKRGLTFSVEMARQGGKNELSAQLEVLLLTMFMGPGGNIVKCAPTFKPQCLISLSRLKQRLNEAGYARFWKSEHGYILRLGKARSLFLSADTSSHVVGATAHILLEVDESQEVDREKFDRDFRPMGATTNVTTVFYGIPWDNSTLLEEMKAHHRELEEKDGIKRHFRFDWQEVAKYNPDYLSYVEAERQRLGEGHPLFLTQYCLKPLAGGGGFLSPAQKAQLQGNHPRQPQPRPGEVYVAGVDVAGQAEAAQDEALRRLKPRQDSTVVSLGRLDFSFCTPFMPQPRVVILEHYWWTGQPHADLYPRLVDLLKNVWGCKKVVVDATGVGEGVASFLQTALGSRVVIPFHITAQSKSRLGFELLSAINSGRLKMYAGDGSADYQEFW